MADKVKFKKNGQWHLEKSDEDGAFDERLSDGTYHPKYQKEAEDHLKNFYSHSPEAKEYLRNNLYNVPAHHRNAKNFQDWKVTPVKSEQTKIYTPQMTSAAETKPSFTGADFTGHANAQPDTEHIYQVHYKNQPQGHLSIFSGGDAMTGGPEGTPHGKLYSVLDRLDPKIRSKLSEHLNGEAFLHHVHNRIAKPKGVN